jgi:hypothetical protein
VIQDTKKPSGKLKGNNRNNQHPSQGPPPVKEVWFAGSHSDMYVGDALPLAPFPHIHQCSGGGNRANPTLNRRAPSLLWMRYEATLAGLALLPLEAPSDSGAETQQHTDLREDRRPIETTNSLNFLSFWWFLEILPFLLWKSHISDAKEASKSFVPANFLSFWWWLTKIFHILDGQTDMESTNYSWWVLRC